MDLRATEAASIIPWFSHHINQVKDITVTLDRSSDLATGTAPAGEAVILSAEDMDGRQELFRATADGAGAFSVAMAPRVDLGSGWRVRAAYPSSSNVSVGRLAVLPRVRVGVDLPISQGLAEPGRMLTVTLRSAAGAIKARAPPRPMTRAATGSISSARRGPSLRPATAWRSRLPTTSAIPCCCACPS
ncbi:MAG: hypothetical protein IPJ58_16265 [Ardenticatenia bacterium]|nr:hypothetical protein [Ardenticatenia bacterium]